MDGFLKILSIHRILIYFEIFKKNKIDYIDENLVSIRRTTNSMSSDKKLQLIREIEEQKILHQITEDFNLTLNKS